MPQHALDHSGSNAKRHAICAALWLGDGSECGAEKRDVRWESMRGALMKHEAVIEFGGTGIAVLAGMLLAGCAGSEGPTQPAVPVFAEVSVGMFHACATTTSGTAYCWGYDGDGELGDGTWTGPEQCAGAPCSTKAMLMTGGLRFAQVSTGGGFTCGVTTSQAAYCWGVDSLGELGIGTTTGPQQCPTTPPASSAHACGTRPVAVAGDLRFAAISAGSFSACALTTTGAAYCWGANHYGQLGDGTTTNSAVPVAVAGRLTFAGVRVGSDHACGVTTAGAAYCWGDNGLGQLGNGTTANSSVPVAVAGGLTFADIGPGDLLTCGVTTSQSAYCWGWNNAGALGAGTTTGPQQCGGWPCSMTPVAVAGGNRFRVVSAGEGNGFACGVTTTGAAYCWGYDFAGQLGIGTDANSATPAAVKGGHVFTTVRAAGSDGGLGLACGVTSAGALYCWGANNDGQLGNGTSGSNSNSYVPLQVWVP